MKNVGLTYFKPSGKYYSQATYTTALDSDYEIYNQVKNMEKGRFPGLSETSLWDGYILVIPNEGEPKLIDLTWRDK